MTDTTKTKTNTNGKTAADDEEPKELTEDEKYYQELRTFKPPDGWIGGYMNLTSKMVVAAIAEKYGVNVVGVNKSNTLAMSMFTESGKK